MEQQYIDFIKIFKKLPLDQQRLLFSIECESVTKSMDKVLIESWEQRCKDAEKDIDEYMGINASEFKGRLIDPVNGSLTKLFFDFRDLPASEKERCGNIFKEVKNKGLSKLKLLLTQK